MLFCRLHLLVFKSSAIKLFFRGQTNFVGFGLEYTTNLPVTSWESNPVSPAVVSDQFVVSNNITVGNKFFRLKK